MSQGEQYRLFVAIDLPDSIKSEIAGLTRQLSGVRLVKPEQLHLTLRFIGEVDEQAMRAIMNSLATVMSPPLTLSLSGAGYFPQGRHPRVLWIGLKPDKLLLQLQNKIELAVQAAGITGDTRPFTPHITIARTKEGGCPETIEFASRHASFCSLPFQADSFLLYRSSFCNQSVSHSILSAYQLSLPLP